MSAILNELDHWRAYFLRFTLAFSPARKIFVSRALRLLFFISFSLTLNFFLALAVPLWLLAIGPLVLGITHLFSSFRFVPQAITPNKFEQKNLTKLIAMAVIGVGGLRVLQLRGFPIPNLLGLLDAWEWGVLFFCFLAMSYFLHRRKSILLALIAFSVMAGSVWNAPLITGAALMIGHNFVPFFYWIKFAKTTNERRVGYGALVMFTLVHIAFITGLTDSLAQHIRLVNPDFGASFDPLALAHQLLPTSSSLALLERGISMFAFGQAVHYFLWIKIIPEEAIRQQVPLSFSQSQKAVLRDLGLRLSQVALIAALGFIGFAFFFKIGILREIYIAGAAAHGYAELAGLPFLFARKI